jgi:hypothetical protein
MLLTAVFFVSLSTLAFEVLLTRVFSISQWNHLSFMVISIALFGFAASGTFLSLFEARRQSRDLPPGSYSSVDIIVCLYSFSAGFSFLVLNHIPLDYFRLPVEPMQCLYLMTAFLVLALPFFFSGLLISLAYATRPEKTGLVYFACMAGSACGAVLPVPLLPRMGEGKLIIVSTLVPLLPVIFSTLKPSGKPTWAAPRTLNRRIAAAGCCLAILILAVFLLTPAGVSLIRIKPSPYKALSQVLRFPESGIVATMTGIRGRIDLIKSPYIRFAPGLSLKYTAALPRQHALFTDGDNQFVLYDIIEKKDAQFAEFMLSYSGYHLTRDPGNILLIEDGGGSAIPCAIASGAQRISIIAQNRHLAARIRRHYPFRVIKQNPRDFFVQTRNLYDIIQLENWGASIPGTSALDQNHLLTRDAFFQYFNRLAANGLIIISRRLLLPPSDSLRLWGTAYEALKKAGVGNPERHLCILRNWDTFTLLISKPILSTRAVIDFARSLNFDVVFLESVPLGMVNRFNVFDQPYHFQKINLLAAAYKSGNEKNFFRHYILDVAPQSDRRPFPERFMKWSELGELYHSLGNRFYTLVMSGEIVVAVVFAEALIVALLLLFIPLVVITRGIRKPSLSRIVYFFAVGAGFMMTELYFIKRFIILVGNPVISFTLVVAGILIFTSLGGLWVQKKGRFSLRFPLSVLIAVLILEALGLELLMTHIQKTSTGLRSTIALLFLFPAGFLMGLPFPLGMCYILHTPAQRAYVWSVNGCASVLASIAAAQAALSLGIPYVVVFAILAYLLAFFVAGESSGSGFKLT